MVTRDVWGGNGCCTLFMWNSAANGAADSGLLNPRQDGDMSIIFHLGAAVDHVINVAEFGNMLEIDPQGAVLYKIYRV